MILFVILARYSSGGEALFVGIMQGLLIFGVIGIYRWIKSNRKKNKKE